MNNCPVTSNDENCYIEKTVDKIKKDPLTTGYEVSLVSNNELALYTSNPLYPDDFDTKISITKQGDSVGVKFRNKKKSVAVLFSSVQDFYNFKELCITILEAENTMKEHIEEYHNG